MDYTRRFRVRPGSKVRLADWDPDDTGGIRDKDDAQDVLVKNAQRLYDLQYLLYAENRRAVLIVLQGMDASGKDGTIRHVMAGLNPQGCHVTAFKQPSSEELEHDFLWRIHKAVPRRGEIGIFNRSHYEDVLIVRVHDLVPKNVWRRRYDQINAFEENLAGSDITVLKLFLHISKDEQLHRFQARLDDPARLWKVNEGDFEERKYWDDYIEAYEAALSRCSTAHAPWYIIPANRKWFRNVAISQILVDTLEGFRMKFPKPTIDPSKIKLR